jgi:O-antigen ligase
MKPINNRTLSLFYQALFLLFFTGLIFSFRAVSSISIAALLFTGVISDPRAFISIFRRKEISLFLLACLLVWLLQVFSLLYTHDQKEGMSSILMKSGILLTPIAILSTDYLSHETLKKLCWHYCLLLFLAIAICLSIAIFRYSDTQDSSVFFYHQLVSPIKQHAIYFSVLVMAGFVYCSVQVPENKWTWAGIIIFPPFLYLLASKLMIALFIVYLLILIIRSIRNRSSRFVVTAGLILIVAVSLLILFKTKNPVSRRFTEITQHDLSIVERDQFDPSVYFNGLQFRLLLWKWVPEILQQKNAWILGVSPGDAQASLDQLYLSKHLYAGDPAHNDRGFLIYNTHDQFLQSFLENGIIGLLIFAFFYFNVLRLGWRLRDNALGFMTILLASLVFTEAVLEIQYGIIIYSSFPLFIHFYSKKAMKGSD